MGRSELWESDDPETQARAVALCNSPCPLFEWCRAEARTLRKLGGMEIEGVWGGEIYPPVREA